MQVRALNPGDAQQLGSSRWYSRWLAPSMNVALLGVILAVSRILEPEAQDVVLRLLAVAGPLGYAARRPFHMDEGYVSETPEETRDPAAARRLNRLMARNDMLILALFACGVFFLAYPSSPWWVKCLLGVPLYYLATGTSGEMAVRARELRLRSGTAIFFGSKWGKSLTTSAGANSDDPLWAPITRILSCGTGKAKASAFAASTAVLLLTMPVVEASPLAGRLLAHVAPEHVSVFGITIGVEGGSQGAGESGSKKGPARPRTYADHCPGDPVPGYWAPEPQASLLYALWLGGVGVAGAGAIEAGCARAAEPVAGDPVLWTATGYCRGSLRSLGIVAPERPPALLYDGAARFALEQAELGRLLGASPRAPFGAGDVYAVETVDGTHVLFRALSSGGRLRPRHARRSCEDAVTRNVAYTNVPPGLIGYWMTLAAEAPVTPVETGAVGGFAFVNAAGRVLATARCGHPAACLVTRNGETWLSWGRRWVAVDEVQPLAVAMPVQRLRGRR